MIPGLSHYTARLGSKWLFKPRQPGLAGGSVWVGEENGVMGKWGSSSTAASWGPWHSRRA